MKSCGSEAAAICNVEGSGIIIRSKPSNLKLSFTTINPDVFIMGFEYPVAVILVFSCCDVPLTNESI